MRLAEVQARGRKEDYCLDAQTALLRRKCWAIASHWFRIGWGALASTFPFSSVLFSLKYPHELSLRQLYFVIEHHVARARRRHWARSLSMNSFSHLVGTLSRYFHGEALSSLFSNRVLGLTEQRGSLVHLHRVVAMRSREQTIAVWEASSFHYFLHLVLYFFLLALYVGVARWVESAGVALVEHAWDHDRRPLWVVFSGRAGHIGRQGTIVRLLRHILRWQGTRRHTWWRVLVVSGVDRGHIFDGGVPHSFSIENSGLRGHIAHGVELGRSRGGRQRERRYVVSYLLNEPGIASILGRGRKWGLCPHELSSLTWVASVMGLTSWELPGVSAYFSELV